MHVRKERISDGENVDTDVYRVLIELRGDIARTLVTPFHQRAEAEYLRQQLRRRLVPDEPAE